MSLHHYEPRGVREAIAATLLRATLRALLKPALSPRLSIARQRRWIEKLTVLSLLPKQVRVETAAVGGVSGEWVRAESAGTTRGTLLYLHGGAYCIGSARTHRVLTMHLARRSGLAVFAADYRLAPEHPFPAALDDALAVVRALNAQGLGPVVIAGDSAGGGLALLTALALRDAGDAAPAALALLSPWADLTLQTAPATPPRGEAMLSRAWGEACAGHFLAGADARVASPLAADLHGLPPTLIQCGTDELLHAESLRLHDAMQAAAVPVRCEVTQRRWHVFQLHAGAMPSADQAVARIADFIGRTLQQPAAAEVQQREVVILGAGMSGLCLGVQLKAAGQHDFVILEKSEGLGGTWWDNRYPGAHVDVPAPLYSFSFAPNPNWKRRFAAAPEIQAYMNGCAERHGLQPHLHFGTTVAEAQFDEARGRWAIRTADGRRFDARFFVCSTGPLSQPRWPAIAGLDSFRGDKLHSARWDASVPLQGRRVAVIGTGSTASQLVPPLAEQATRLHVFQRTANWVMPRLDRPYHRLDRWLAHVPPYAWAVRTFWYGLLELGRRGFDEGTFGRRMMMRTVKHHLRVQVPDAALRAQLVPGYPLGCKRIIYSNDFYPALGRPNVELVTSGIEAITPNGIVTQDGQRREIDVLVCATGFDTAHMLSSLAIRGVGGRALSEAWAAGPEAYRGVTVAGFPNLFLTLGPNTGTGHTSTLLYIEPQVQFILRAMRRVREQGVQAIGVRDDVFVAHNAALQGRLDGSVWSHCRSWYRMDNGKIVALWPGFTREYVRGLERPDWADYQFT